MNARTSLAYTLAIAAVLFCLVCPVLSGVAYVAFQEIVYPASTPVPIVNEAESEYYRGVYDVCVLLYTSSGGDDFGAVRDCNTLADQAAESGWYAEPSKGYEP